MSKKKEWRDASKLKRIDVFTAIGLEPVELPAIEYTYEPPERTISIRQAATRIAQLNEEYPG